MIGTLDERNAAIEKLQHDTFDLLVIGGGITGVGIAQDKLKNILSLVSPTENGGEIFNTYYSKGKYELNGNILKVNLHKGETVMIKNGFE